MQMPGVVVLGAADVLNGRVLSEAQRHVKASHVKAAFLKGEDEPQATLVQYLLGAGSKAFETAGKVFAATTKEKPENVQVAVVNINLPLGDTFKNGEYTELKEVFPNLESVILCCDHSKVLAIGIP